MTKYNGTDLLVTEDGDLIIGEDGDFLIARKQQFVKQSAANRLRTSDPDWFDYKVNDIGANLEDLLGQPNTIETARDGVEKIVRCLTRADFISQKDIYIRPVPIDKYTIQFYIFIQMDGIKDPIGFVIIFNLESGVVVRGVQDDSNG